MTRKFRPIENNITQTDKIQRTSALETYYFIEKQYSYPSFDSIEFLSIIYFVKRKEKADSLSVCLDASMFVFYLLRNSMHNASNLVLFLE